MLPLTIIFSLVVMVAIYGAFRIYHKADNYEQLAERMF